MCGEGIEFRSAVKLDVISVAVDGRGWTVDEFSTWCRLPEIYSVVARVVEEFKCVLEVWCTPMWNKTTEKVTYYLIFVIF